VITFTGISISAHQPYLYVITMMSTKVTQ